MGSSSTLNELNAPDHYHEDVTGWHCVFCVCVDQRIYQICSIHIPVLQSVRRACAPFVMLVSNTASSTFRHIADER